MGNEQREELKKAYVNFFERQRPDVFLTLASNSNVIEATMRRKLSAFFAHLDRAHLGRYWQRKPKHMRVGGFYALEKVGVNTHAHCFINFKRGNQLGNELLVSKIWNKICPSGSANFQVISQAQGAINYGLKEMEGRNYTFDNICFVEDFHSKQ